MNGEDIAKREAKEVIADFVPDEPNNISGVTKPNAFVYKDRSGKICILFNSSYKNETGQGWLGGIDGNNLIGDCAPFYGS